MQTFDPHNPQLSLAQYAPTLTRGAAVRESRSSAAAASGRLEAHPGEYAAVALPDVREFLRQAEAFLRAGDPWGATARTKMSVRGANAIHSRVGDDVRGEVALSVERLAAAEQAVREEVKRRHALHVANERRAARITDEVTHAHLS